MLPFPGAPDNLGSATEVRSTLIGSSIRMLRARGHFDRYCSLLPAAHRATILDSVAGQWLPIELGVAHYSACESLGLTVAEPIEMGASVSHLIHGTLLGAAIRLAKDAGVTPWTLLPNGNRLYRRILRGGGGTQVAKVGPKEARVDVVGVPMLAIPYYRNALRGMYHAAVGLFCTQAYVRGSSRTSQDTGAVVLRIAWA